MLFSQDLPSNDLGMVEPKLGSVETEVAGHDYVLQQSLGLLTSDRKGGTTGAVLWKITPRLATWLASLPPLLSDLNILHPDATVVELGCGVAGLIGLVLSQMVKCYILTDQDYVMKYLKENISANLPDEKQPKNRGKRRTDVKVTAVQQVLKTMPLDWEHDSAENLKAVMAPGTTIDLVLLCDCVYNDFLVKPLVQTCVDICRLGSSESKVTVVMIAQQLRADSIFQLFLGTLMKDFDVWQVPDDKIGPDLRSGSGYVVHLAALRVSQTW